MNSNASDIWPRGQGVVPFALSGTVKALGALVPLLAAALVLAQSLWRRKPSVYDQFERVGNPWWMPKLLGKDATALLSEGYERVSLVPLSFTAENLFPTAGQSSC